MLKKSLTSFGKEVVLADWKDYILLDGKHGTTHFGVEGRELWTQFIDEIKNQDDGFSIHYYVNREKAWDIFNNVSGNYFISFNGHTSHFNLYIQDKKTHTHLKLAYDIKGGTLFQKS